MKIVLNMADKTKKEFAYDDVHSIVFIYPDNSEFKIMPDEERASFRVLSIYNLCVASRASNHIEIKEDMVR